MIVKRYFSNLSLNLVVALVLLILYLPGLGLLLIHRVINEGAQDRLEQQREFVQYMDEKINYDPMITKFTRKTVAETGDRIEYEFYDKDGVLLAHDVSAKISDNEKELKSRIYYDKYKTIIARDIYEPINDISVSWVYNSDVFKRREYLNQNGEMLLCEYFDEFGVPMPFLTSRNACGFSETTILSPFPPPLFFFYR